jgi:hypothetical protein
LKRYVTFLYIAIVLMLLVIALDTESPRTVITILDYGISIDVIIAFILGLIPFVWKEIKNRHRYPSKLFKTMFDPNTNYEKETFGKPLILPFKHSGMVYGFFLFAETRKVIDDIKRIGIRPQVKKSWLIRWLSDYNSKTNNIALDERDNPPIRIVNIKDIHSDQNYFTITDDGNCGKWLDYRNSVKMIPDAKMVFWVEIQVNKSWQGYIDFRISTDDGRRVSHHKCQLIRL